MEKILLSHGGGGEEMNALINDIIFKAFDNEILKSANDAALLRLNSTNLAFTTDSFVVTPLFFSGGDIGKIAICGTVNDLLMVGAKPLYLSCSFIIEEGFSIDEFKQILNSMSKTAKKAGVFIVCGDTKVVPKGKCDKIFINTSGVGEVIKEINTINLGSQQKAKILVSGDIARHGSVIMQARDELGFESELESDCKPLNEVVLEILKTITPLAMRDATRGGLSAVLNEWAKFCKVSIKVKEARIKISDEVMGICEILGFEPCDLANEGTFVLAVEEKDALKALEILQKFDKNANIIGETFKDDKNRVILETIYGVERFLEPPKGELLPRIC
ncbi:hydrogenase expression/formation protein HypE [Campylobacter corcagiensis]|uniref:Hydrogenase expression/formation protein HypE n=1 Tax=Campylobacter corcagiensis TaxID=1448857 RepID=A0A7M1LGE1_9BACT|nr:hydrogenase expression/formation protein HypE [Campylobacter corcagiensis]QKF64732.1 hydrogenase expression/formation protein HypE [Campylobacter corcagiensis]QOQ87104.1 hydrogenase expression/formation protein HypE [Campylobacter corcagiensis]